MGRVERCGKVERCGEGREGWGEGREGCGEGRRGCGEGVGVGVSLLLYKAPAATTTRELVGRWAVLFCFRCFSRLSAESG